MPRFVEVARCACPVELAPAVIHVMRATGSAPTSLYRGEDPEAVAILRRNGKATQADLVAEPRRHGVVGTPNPVGRSTHELRSDGRAFPGPAGRKLDPVQCGQDWPDADIPQVMAAYRKLGCAPVHPYPGGIEYHHICCTRAPTRRIDPLRVLGVLPLTPGDRSSLVPGLQRYLLRAKLLPRDFDVADRVGTYGPVTVAAVRRFQRSLGLAADGVVGPRTFAALRRRYAWRVWSRGARHRRTSDAGISLIVAFEGFRSTPYADPAGFATVGYGHLLGRRPVRPRDRRARWVAGQARPGVLTMAEARRLLAADLSRSYERAVDDLDLPINQSQFDALVSFVYNLGPGAISAETGIGRALRRNDWAAAADEMLRWNRAGSEVLPGLERRRQAERALFLSRPEGLTMATGRIVQ